MVGELTVKICGLRETRHIELVHQLGCDYFGMIHHSKSPRHVSIAEITKLTPSIPTGRAVAVVVEPTLDTISELKAAGADIIQIHFNLQWMEQLNAIRDHWGSEQPLWLVPRVAPGAAFPEAILKFAHAVLLDTYSENHYGGTGEVGAWDEFKAFSLRYPDTQFILAGGLNSENIQAAIRATGAGFIDLSSGVESLQGVKSEDKIRALFAKLESMNG